MVPHSTCRPVFDKARRRVSVLLDGRHLTLASFLLYVVCTQLFLDLHNKLNEQLSIIMHNPCQLYKLFFNIIIIKTLFINTKRYRHFTYPIYHHVLAECLLFKTPIYRIFKSYIYQWDKCHLLATLYMAVCR